MLSALAVAVDGIGFSPMLVAVRGLGDVATASARAEFFGWNTAGPGFSALVQASRRRRVEVEIDDEQVAVMVSAVLN